MEEVLEIFSCNDWLLVHSEKADDGFISKFGLILSDDTKKWAEAGSVTFEKEPIDVKNFASYNTNRLTITSSIKGFRIIEGKAINFLYNEMCDYLSKEHGAYRFKIDIWVPEMKFQYFKFSKLLRECEYTIDIEKSSLHIDETGEKLPFENENLEMPHPENGYDDFYYPLAIMQYLGIGMKELEVCMNTKCDIYEIIKTEA